MYALNGPFGQDDILGRRRRSKREHNLALHLVDAEEDWIENKEMKLAATIFSSNYV